MAMMIGWRKFSEFAKQCSAQGNWTEVASIRGDKIGASGFNRQWGNGARSIGFRSQKARECNDAVRAMMIRSLTEQVVPELFENAVDSEINKFVCGSTNRVPTGLLDQLKGKLGDVLREDDFNRGRPLTARRIAMIDARLSQLKGMSPGETELEPLRRVVDDWSSLQNRRRYLAHRVVEALRTGIYYPEDIWETAAVLSASPLFALELQEAVRGVRMDDKAKNLLKFSDTVRRFMRKSHDSDIDAKGMKRLYGILIDDNADEIRKECLLECAEPYLSVYRNKPNLAFFYDGPEADTVDLSAEFDTGDLPTESDTGDLPTESDTGDLPTESDTDDLSTESDPNAVAANLEERFTVKGRLDHAAMDCFLHLTLLPEFRDTIGEIGERDECIVKLRKFPNGELSVDVWVFGDLDRYATIVITEGNTKLTKASRRGEEEPYSGLGIQ